MAINLVTEPGTSAPYNAADYVAQNGLISANEVPAGSVFDDWEAVGSAPLLKQGVFIRHAGNTYQVQTTDEAISESPSAGLNYVILTLSGTVITAAWATSLSGFTWNPAYGGWYHSDGRQAMLDVCYLDESNYRRGRGLNGFNTYYLADGKMYIGGAVLDSLEIDGNLIPMENTTEGTVSISNGGSWVVPRGIYTISNLKRNEAGTDYDTWLECQLGGFWYRMDTLDPGSVTGLVMSWAYQVISDGTNYRVRNVHDGGSSRTVYWRKH